MEPPQRARHSLRSMRSSASGFSQTGQSDASESLYSDGFTASSQESSNQYGDQEDYDSEDYESEEFVDDISEDGCDGRRSAVRIFDAGDRDAAEVTENMRWRPGYRPPLTEEEKWAKEKDEKMRHVHFHHSLTPLAAAAHAHVCDAGLIQFDPMLNPARAPLFHVDESHHSVREAAAQVVASLHHLTNEHPAEKDTQGAHDPSHPVHSSVRSAAQGVIAFLSQSPDPKTQEFQPKARGTRKTTLKENESVFSGSDDDSESGDDAITGVLHAGLEPPSRHHKAMRSAAADVHAALDILLVSNHGALGQHSRNKLVDAGPAKKATSSKNPYGESGRPLNQTKLAMHSEGGFLDSLLPPTRNPRASANYAAAGDGEADSQSSSRRGKHPTTRTQRKMKGALMEMSDVYQSTVMGMSRLSREKNEHTDEATMLRHECNKWRNQSDELWKQIQDMREQLQPQAKTSPMHNGRGIASPQCARAG